MKIPSRAFGFVRVGLQNSFGVRVPDFGTGGDYDNPLLNDVEAGDEAAGVEFVLVVPAQMSDGVLALRTDGGLSFTGAADGTYSQSTPLYVYTPGDAAPVRRYVTGTTDPTLTINVGAAAQHESGGASSAISVSAAGAGTAAESASGGASGVASVSAGGAGAAAESASGGASATVTVTAAGEGTSSEDTAEHYSGGASAVVGVTSAGAGTADMATWYVRPDTAHSATRDGTSYATAWGGWATISWASLAAGDDLYVCGTHSIAADISVGAHGASSGGAGTAKVVIRGDYAPDPGAIVPSSPGAKLLNNRANTEIRGLTLTGNAGPCLFIDSGAARCSYIGNRFIGSNPTASSAIVTIASANGKNHADLLFEGNTFEGACGPAGALAWFVAAAGAVSTLTRVSVIGNRFEGVVSARSLVHFRVDQAASVTCTMTDIVVERNEFNDTQGVLIELSSSDKTFGRHSGVRVKHNQARNAALASGSSVLGGFIVVSGFTDSATLGFGVNEIAMNRGYGLVGVYGGANLFWGKYRVYLNVFEDLDTQTIDGNGVLLDHGCNGVEVFGNTVRRANGLPGVNNSGCGLMILDAIGVRAWSNIFEDCKSGVYWGAKQHPDTGSVDYQVSDVFNNTILSPTYAGFQLLPTADTDDNTAQNNAVIGGPGASVISGVTWVGESDNWFYGTGSASGHVLGSGSETTDPGVTDSGIPLPNSTLLTQGVDLGWRRDIRGILSRRHVGAYGAGRLVAA